MGNPFTEPEIILCTYIARFGRDTFREYDIVRVQNRSESSIKMKVQNIAAMLDEEGYEHSPKVSKLSGLPTGQKGRRTNWDIVKHLVELSKKELKEQCIEILEN